MRINFSILDWEFGFIVSARRILRTPVQGVTNRTKDGYYILFLDYDDLEFSWVLDELRDIRRAYCLSEIYLFETSKDKYSAVCFDKMSREMYQEILSRSSCDSYYKKIPWTFGKRVSTLRSSPKKGVAIKLKYIVSPFSNCKNRVQSTAHRIFFKKQITNMIEPAKKEDGLLDLVVAGYRI